MTIQTHYFATRTLARANVAVLKGKLKDFGTTAPKGERWAVLVEVPSIDIEKLNEVQENFVSAVEEVNAIDSSRLAAREITTADIKAMANQVSGIIGEQTLKTPNNKPVRVSWRRNMTAVRLANHLAKVS